MPKERRTKDEGDNDYNDAQLIVLISSLTAKNLRAPFLTDLSALHSGCDEKAKWLNGKPRITT